MTETVNKPASAEGQPLVKKVRRLASAARFIIVLATIAALVGWGVYAVTTVAPNPNDSASVFGAFHGAPPFNWGEEMYNLKPNATVSFVFHLGHGPGTGCGGYKPVGAARNGTLYVSCLLPKPNSTLTSYLADYVSFNLVPDSRCCQQAYYSWVSGPTGNLTEPQGGGGFFEASQEGNYSEHISNTAILGPGAIPLGVVNGTLTFTLGHVLFSRPYFAVGLATLGMAGVFTAYIINSTLSNQTRRQKRQRERSPPMMQIPREMSD